MHMTGDYIKTDNDQYYILASSTYADDRVKVLNFGDTFGIFDRWGDIKQLGEGIQGIYHHGTRFISDFELQINGTRPLLLSSNIKKENEILSVDLTNPDLHMADGRTLLKGDLHISKTKFLQHGACHASFVVKNYGQNTCKLRLTFLFKGDFADIFEIRGMKREKRGQLQGPQLHQSHGIIINYRGLDSVMRSSIIEFSPAPTTLDTSYVGYEIELPPKQSIRIECRIKCQEQGDSVEEVSYSGAYDKIQSQLDANKRLISTIYTSNEQFNNWINRSQHDLLSLLSETPHGVYPYAGVPWYNTAFGRDGIITALQTLWIAPKIAHGVLQYLAALQSTEDNPRLDAEPGKIMHETRGGEMAGTGEIPFKRYYGTVDATPLFVVLAGEYLHRTNDLPTIRTLWPNIVAALDWIDNYGDIDGDGFVEYQHKAANGLTNQGWKDSHDSVSDKDGSLASPPIALCEVQGYVYQAKLAAANIAQQLGDHTKSRQLIEQAQQLKERFNKHFWDDNIQCYVLALDGHKKPCRVVSSNAGHALYSGIAEPEKAKQLVQTLLGPSMFSGWGIRTLATDAERYNPMSYHNGSIWPHDNALIARGMANYHYTTEAQKIMQGLFDASLFIDLQRLPELFCGFERVKGQGPTAYPVACSPQAWSVASVFMLLQSCLQIDIDARQKKVVFNKPSLPEYMQELHLSDLQVTGGSVTIAFYRYESDLCIHVIHKPDDWEVVCLY